ncbi:MAG: dCTP deaminase [Candidatus Thermoplasmatota archaeon]|nr:dCTP deaminase [Candidatus Thermoplasmatota archaeon]
MILNDKQIKRLCEEVPPMIEPFEGTQKGKPSYGLGSFGYDIRLGKTFLVPKRDYVKRIGQYKLAGNSSDLFIIDTDSILTPLDPERNKRNFTVETCEEKFILYPNTCVLGESVERFNIPENIFVLSFGKSTYARLGVVPHVTPLEPGWKNSVLTIEIANTGTLPVELIVGQGIAQLVFFRGNRPKRVYGEKESGGIYQNQTGVWLPR